MGFLRQLPPPIWAYRGTHAFRIHMPHDLTVVVACETAGCDQWRTGWETVCDESTREGTLVAAWIRSGQSGRTYRELVAVAGQPAVFRFDSRQRCFNEHRTRPGRLLVHHDGHVAREHVSLADLAEDYTEHMGGIAARQERG